MSFSLKGFTQNELASHLFVFLVYFLALTILRFKFDFGLLWIWIGGLLGTFLLDVDHLLYWFWTHPEKEDSVRAKEIIKNVKIIRVNQVIRVIHDLYVLLKENHQSHNRLTFHTVTFQIILLVLSVYMLSSSGSYFGSGLVLAMNLHLLKDVWRDYFVKGKEGLADWFLWQVRGWGVERYLREYLLLVTGVFLLMSGLFV